MPGRSDGRWRSVPGRWPSVPGRWSGVPERRPCIPEAHRIDPRVYQPPQRLGHSRVIAGEGDAQPQLAGWQHGAVRPARRDQVVYGLGEEELAVESRSGSEECGEKVTQGREDLRLEPPEVGADGGSHGDVDRPAGHVPAHDPVSFPAEPQALGQPLESTPFVDLAEAAGDASALRQGGLEGVADEKDAGGGWRGRPRGAGTRGFSTTRVDARPAHRPRQRRVRPPPVEVVRIADREGTLHVFARREDGVPGAPGPDPSGRRLIHQPRMDHPLVGVADVEVSRRIAKMRVEVRPQRLLDDEQEAGESRQRRIVEGVVEQGLAARTDGRELLEAAEPGGAAGCEDHEGERWIHGPSGRVSRGQSLHGVCSATRRASVVALRVLNNRPESVVHGVLSHPPGVLHMAGCNKMLLLEFCNTWQRGVAEKNIAPRRRHHQHSANDGRP